MVILRATSILKGYRGDMGIVISILGEHKGDI
jgi:hypothetical protein